MDGGGGRTSDLTPQGRAAYWRLREEGDRARAAMRPHIDAALADLAPIVGDAPATTRRFLARAALEELADAVGEAETLKYLSWVAATLSTGARRG